MTLSLCLSRNHSVIHGITSECLLVAENESIESGRLYGSGLWKRLYLVGGSHFLALASSHVNNDICISKRSFQIQFFKNKSKAGHVTGCFLSLICDPHEWKDLTLCFPLPLEWVCGVHFYWWLNPCWQVQNFKVLESRVPSDNTRLFYKYTGNLPPGCYSHFGWLVGRLVWNGASFNSGLALNLLCTWDWPWISDLPAFIFIVLGL